VLDRIHDFRRRLQESVAERRVDSAHGIGLFCDSLPIVYDVNYLRADRLAPAEELAEEADGLMERFWHRRVLTDAGGGKLARRFSELGWTRSTHVIMGHRRPPDRSVDTSRVREVSLDELEEAHTHVTLAEPYGDTELARQLLEAKRRVTAAVPTRFFAAFDGGALAAYCELRSDGTTAQIEDVNTIEAHRGKGLGRAVVTKAMAEGLAGAGTLFIEALADDWPKDLYARLGFDVLDERHLFLRPPPALSRIRVRTPRLELRLATVAELRELAHVAKQGIHDPQEMPFEVPWTDAAGTPGFVEDTVEHHLGQQRSWRPTDWTFTLVAFQDGRPIGVQSLRGRDFARRREVDTGSWLGRPSQGRGLGTEMRAGVLSFAFELLGAKRATSGAIDANPQSLGVSRKLGYEVVGEHMVAPRGVDRPHTDLVLERERFRSPVPVEVVGFDGLQSLFGVEP
jgi:RimJ/RimL family protein N-acetyltransferase/GNAT superfamily N-acetyltransferase